MAKLKIALLTFMAILTAQGAFAQNSNRPAPSVFVETVENKTFSEQIEALGTLEPNERVDLTLNVADRVTAIYFDDGQRIKEGKTLLSLAQREQIALVESAEATLEEASRQLTRAERLAEESAIPRSQLDEAERNYNNASAQLRAVQSRQKDRVLVAPFDGVLGFRQVSVGSYVRAGDVVATLIDDSEMKLEFSVSSIYLRALKPGTEIVVTTADLPGEKFKGTIATIDNAIDPVTRSVSVRAILPNPDLVLKSGMFMKVTLLASPRNAPSIPEGSIQPRGPDNFVFKVVEVDGVPTTYRTQVQLGARQDGYVEVIAGLDLGDVIVSEGLIGVREGAPVTIKDRSMLSPSGSSPSISPTSGDDTTVQTATAPAGR